MQGTRLIEFRKMQIPADIVVNTMIMAMAAHEDQPSDQTIYHVGSSARNSMTHIDLQRFSYQYFTQKPLIDKNGKAIKLGKVTLFNSMAKFHRYLAIRYLIFLKVRSYQYKLHKMENIISILGHMELTGKNFSVRSYID